MTFGLFLKAILSIFYTKSADMPYQQLCLMFGIAESFIMFDKFSVAIAAVFVIASIAKFFSQRHRTKETAYKFFPQTLLKNFFTSFPV
jgi:hypothetical protein